MLEYVGGELGLKNYLGRITPGQNYPRRITPEESPGVIGLLFSYREPKSQAILTFVCSRKDDKQC